MKEPIAGSILIFVPNGTVCSERLNAVSRMRVAKTNSFSNGGLAMEKLRVFPAASVSGGLRRVTYLEAMTIVDKAIRRASGFAGEIREYDSLDTLGTTSPEFRRELKLGLVSELRARGYALDFQDFDFNILKTVSDLCQLLLDNGQPLQLPVIVEDRKMIDLLRPVDTPVKMKKMKKKIKKGIEPKGAEHFVLADDSKLFIVKSPGPMRLYLVGLTLNL
ncbi:MAG: hypothetical protein WCE73_18880 [Candidatus Angelobacter sp.]